MWTRKQVKTRGKKAFKRNYWKSVLIALILSLIIGGGSMSGGSFGGGFPTTNYSQIQEEATDSKDDDGGILIGEVDDDAVESEDQSSDTASDDEFNVDINSEDLPAGAIISIVVIAFLVALVIIAAAIALDAFIFNPIEMGCRKFFFKNLDEDAKMSNLVFAFDHGYKNVVKTMFFRDLYIVLWSMLFVIPGIVKSYEYRMIPYIIAENPDMSKEAAFAESKRLMTGNKWKAFVLDLSFIGWEILSLLTCGILSIFYVDPYIHSTDAALYEALKYGVEEA